MKKETRVEVQRDGAWMEAVVVVAYGSGRGRRYKVRYSHHYNKQPLTEELEDVPVTRVRPIPPPTPHNYNYSIGNNAVEVFDKDCWWPGIIDTQVIFTDSELVLVYFPRTGIRKMYHCSKLRPAQEYIKGKWCRLLSQQTSNIIYEGKYPMVENSGITSIASSPGDLQTNAQSQRQIEEEEVTNHRRHSDWIKNRTTLGVEESSIQAIRNRDSRKPKNFHHGNAILKNVVALSQKESNNVEQDQRRNSLAPHSKGVKRVYVHDLRKDQTYGGIQNAPGNNFKRFKHTEPTTAMDQIQMGILKYIETPAEICTRSVALGSYRTEIDNKNRTNNALNVVAEERLETHHRELLAYHSVLEAFYAQSQSHLTWERENLLSSLRLALHITIDEHIDKLKSLISQS